MSWLRNLARGIGYVFNPLGAVIDYFQGVPDKNGQLQESGFSKTKSSVSNWWNNVRSRVSGWWNNVTNSQTWNDLTGKSQIELQNQLNRDLAEEEYQRNIQSISDTAAAYEAAGFNRNLLYSGASPASYQAPSLQAYSGSSKLDTILSRVGKVIGLIPAMYQATAALEGIDQARERTKQSEIRTMSMGMSLLDQGYKLGDLQLSRPFDVSMFTRPAMYGGKRHYYNHSPLVQPGSFGNDFWNLYDDTKFRSYADAALKNKFDLLRSIGIKNEMNSTLNSWRGYQYDLDRRFGAAGRIVGMASQGAGAIGRFVSPSMRYFGFK